MCGGAHEGRVSSGFTATERSGAGCVPLTAHECDRAWDARSYSRWTPTVAVNGGRETIFLSA